MNKVRAAAHIVAEKYADFSATQLEDDWTNWHLALWSSVDALVNLMSECCEEELAQWELMNNE